MTLRESGVDAAITVRWKPSTDRARYIASTWLWRGGWAFREGSGPADAVWKLIHR